jgi:hypothetical protein
MRSRGAAADTLVGDVGGAAVGGGCAEGAGAGGGCSPPAGIPLRGGMAPGSSGGSQVKLDRRMLFGAVGMTPPERQ